MDLQHEIAVMALQKLALHLCLNAFGNHGDVQAIAPLPAEKLNR